MLLDMMLEGDRLGEKEVKYLALTSHELNMFLDKEQYQKYVDLLSPEFIHMLEINISEQIIESYQQARDIISSKREEFLKKKNFRLRAMINKKEIAGPQVRNDAQLDLDRKHQKLIKKAFIQKYFTDKDGSVAKYPLFLYQKKPVVNLLRKSGSMINNILNSSQSEAETLKVKEKPRQAYSIDLTKTKLKASLYGDISQKDYYKLKHPESKIIPLSQSNDNANLAGIILNEQEKNRTKAFDKKPPGNLLRFFRAYSSGPFKGKRTETKISAENKDRAANIIQKNFRGYKVRKAVKYMKMMNIDNLSGKIRNFNAEKVLNSKTDASIIKSKSTSPPISRSPTLLMKAESNVKKVGFNLVRQGTHILNTTNNLDLQPSSSYQKQKTLVFDQDYLVSLQKQKTFQFGHDTESSKREAKKSKQKANKSQSKPENKVPDLDNFIIDDFQQAMQDNELQVMTRNFSNHFRRLVNMPDKNGKYPIEWAIEHQNLDMVVFLVENGLSLKKCNFTESQLLDQVKDRRSKAIREYLQLIYRQKSKKTRSSSWANFIHAF